MSIKKFIIYSGLALIVVLNLYLYRSEFKVLIDPNDNIFQYALVDEAKNIWKKIFSGKLSVFYLLDSWNERWAEGFALSSYYAHLPQDVISLIGLISPVGMYKTFVVIRTLMLILMPLMFFWGGTILRLPLGVGLILAFFSQAINTDGLYGIDATSFLWRGWGLSSQLMALFFMPVAFAYSMEYLRNKKNLAKAVLFNFLVAQAHFGMFSLLLISYGLFILYRVFTSTVEQLSSLDKLKVQSSKLKVIAQNLKLDKIFQEIYPAIIFILVTLFSLSYFIVPFFSQGQYRNFSVWDPVWKFDSWGLKQNIIWLLNGDLFDFGRLPIITYCVIFGVLSGLAGLGKTERKNNIFSYLSLVFVVFFILFAGRTTLGKIIDIVPGFSEYHLHRLIVMVQFIGLFLGAWFVYGLFKKLDTVFLALIGTPPPKIIGFLKNLKTGIFAFLIPVALVLVIYLEKPVINYAKDNAIWIDRANKAYLNDLPDYEKIKEELASLPGARVYAGKPGNWGKSFTVGETPLYMVLSQDGFPVIGFLPESWSPNSDPEQFFAENSLEFYNLYNAGYSILPADTKPPDFAKLVITQGKYALYQIKTNGWFDFGISSMAVRSKKTYLLNSTRLWFGSKMFKTGDYPAVDLNSDLPLGNKWFIRLTDLNHFVNLNDGKERSIWIANPYNATAIVPTAKFNKINEKILPNGYAGKITIDADCPNCVLVLKQSYHPNWQVRLNGAKVDTFPVFPFYIGIPVEKSGTYEIVAEYRPNGLKIVLVVLELVVLALFSFRICFFRELEFRFKSS